MADFTSVRVGELPPAQFNGTDLIPHEVAGLLKQGTFTEMANAIGLIIGATAGSGFRAVQVNDGDTLPTTTEQEFILTGAGTFYNVGGGATIVATEGLNVLVSNGTFWSLGVAIPIITPDVVVNPYNQLIYLDSNPKLYSLPSNTKVQTLHLNGGFLYPSMWSQSGDVLTINYPSFDPNGLDEIIISGLTQQTTAPTAPIEGVSFLGEIKVLKVNNAFITSNFDITGLGIGTYSKWAICNGNNGTDSDNGRVFIGYDPNNYALGVQGGSKDAVVVEHSHQIKYSNTGAGTKYPETPYIGDIIGGNMQGTESTGVSGTNKNMQPYTVKLFIQRISL